MLSAARAGLYPSDELESAMTKASSQYRDSAGLPAGWDPKKMVQGMVDGRLMHKDNKDAAFVAAIQKLVDEGTKKLYTRDRLGGKVPDALRVEQVIHVQNDTILEEYKIVREKLRQD